MITAWMLYSVVVGALVTLGAHGIDRATVAARMPRRWTWVGAMALLCALTAVAPWRAMSQRDDGARPVVQPDERGSLASPGTGARDLRDRIAGWLTLPLQKRIDRIAAFVPVTVDRVLATTWALGTLGALALVWLSLRRIDRQRGRWPKTTLLGREVRIAANHGPAVYGVFEPDIVVPTTLLACPSDDQRIVLAHEEEHRLTKDPFLLVLSAVGVALLPWHPGAWWLSSRIRLAIELDCDARVIAGGTSPRCYGEFLVRQAGRITARRSVLPALALLHPRTHLEGRLRAMTTRPAKRTPARVAAVIFTGAAAVAVACSAEVPTAAQVREADATTIVQELRLPTSEVVYVVDGRRVSPEEATRIQASGIATINVVRGSADAAPSEIRIVTLEGAARALASGGGGMLRLRPDGDRGARRVDEIVVQQRIDSASGAVIQKDIIGPVTERTARELEVPAQTPLFVVDGVVKTSLKGIDPQRIQTVEVVKSAAAQRLYGQDGRNGVIRVTTKR